MGVLADTSSALRSVVDALAKGVVKCEHVCNMFLEQLRPFKSWPATTSLEFARLEARVLIENPPTDMAIKAKRINHARK